MFQSFRLSLKKDKNKVSNVVSPLPSLLHHNVGPHLKSYLDKSSISQLDILSKELGKNEYRHYLLQHCIYHILELSDIPSKLYHYQKIKTQLTQLHLIDYFIYIVSKMKWLSKLIDEYDNTQIHRLFLNDIPDANGKSIYQLGVVYQYISKFIFHLSTLVSKRKIILLNIYATHLPNEFNKQYNVDCIQANISYPYKDQSCLLYIINGYISSQCIPRKYIQKLLFSSNSINKHFEYSCLPNNETYITLLKQNITLMNSHFEKLILKQYFEKLTKIKNGY